MSNHFLQHSHMPIAVLIIYIIRKDRKKKLNEKKSKYKLRSSYV